MTKTLGARNLVPDPLLSVDDLAAYLQVPRNTIYRWNCYGDGPPLLHVGKYVRYRMGDVQEWLEAQGGR